MECDKWWNMEAPVWTYKQISKNKVKTYAITHDEEIQYALSLQHDVHTILWL